MKVLLVGGGGREDALAWRLAQSEKCETLYCAPGNAGICRYAKCTGIGAEDINSIVAFVKDKKIDFVVIGPEQPLVAGLADPIRGMGIPVFGPSRDAAILEGSKGFMKDLCKKYDIPTAAYGRFTDIEEAKNFIRAQKAPVVVKADGLAAGKGVIIAQTHEEAEKAAEDMLSGNSFGQAGHEVVIEEFLEGEELSFFALTDGETVLPFGSAQDHKRVGDGDTGPNTGGMGAYSPAHLMTRELHQKIMERIILPTVEGMKKEGRPYTGVLYAGLMIVEGEPKLIEYNARFGDPETQALMVRLYNDLLDVLYAAAQGKLAEYEDKIEWSSMKALCVVMAANGYPGDYIKNTVIKGAEKVNIMERVKVFHAGTVRNEAGDIVNTGGRVLNIVASGETIEEAQKQAYEAIKRIDWPEGFYRHDIGWRAVAAEKGKAA
ncbi:MAG: phosphoribosylamine--glycine ligase [Rhodospirillales bacterium]|nr:phosphoribosylamine--glycine ligase [Alphaproteobacteria bacterium]USO04232.1 MAG: phosphoribosylamine--glycine ligase [Rhodospirillales bacterium]